MRRLLVLLTLAFSLGVGPVFAQTKAPKPKPPQSRAAVEGPAKIESGKAYQLAADIDPANVTAVRFYIDGVQVGADVPISALVNGSISSPSELTSTLKPGVHIFEVAAVNPDHVVKGAPLSVEVGFTAPNAPTNLRLVLVVQVAADGTVTVKVVEATKLPDEHK
jgi:hypothetical protein